MVVGYQKIRRGGSPVAAVSVVSEIGYIWVVIYRAAALAGVGARFLLVEVDLADSVGLRRVFPGRVARASMRGRSQR